MSVISVLVVVAAFVFAGMLWFVRFNPQGLFWMKFGTLSKSVMRDTAHKVGLFLWALAAIRGFLDKEISGIATVALLVGGALLCIGCRLLIARRGMKFGYDVSRAE